MKWRYMVEQAALVALVAILIWMFTLTFLVLFHGLVR